jgi:hypothetical protein
MQAKVRKIRLKELEMEQGVTGISLMNAMVIDSKGYVPVIVYHEADFDNCTFNTKVYYKKEGTKQLYYWLFSGFSSGYYGEGSRGFADFLFNIAGMNLKYEDTLDFLAKGLISNERYLFALDKDFDELIHVHISKNNLKGIGGGRPVRLRNQLLRIVKNWNMQMDMKLIKDRIITA